MRHRWHRLAVRLSLLAALAAGVVVLAMLVTFEHACWIGVSSTSRIPDICQEVRFWPDGPMSAVYHVIFPAYDAVRLALGVVCLPLLAVGVLRRMRFTRRLVLALVVLWIPAIAGSMLAIVLLQTAPSRGCITFLPAGYTQQGCDR